MPKTIDSRKTIGQWGEDLALEYLRSKNYHILAKNYKKPWGEIDIIAEKERIVVFCEVKTNSKELGFSFSPELRVNSKKGRHILRTAKIFINDFYKGQEREWRVDIISITLRRFEGKALIRHFKNVLTDWN